MAHKCFISFKTEDAAYKNYIQKYLNVDMIDKSLNEAISSDDEDTIMRRIREDYLSESTVTIHLIGSSSAENLGWDEQRFIKRELQASLYNGRGNSRSGILGVVLPSVKSLIYKEAYYCSTCNGNHDCVAVNDETVIKEFSYNYYIPNGKCAHTEADRYCVLVDWEDFEKDPNSYIESAFSKRTDPIALKVKVKGGA